MTIYYVDPVNGNDSNNGTSFATAVKTPTALNLNLVTGGDEVRFAESKVVDTGYDATFTLQQAYQAGGINLSNATNTSPIQITSLANHGLVTGDWVYVTAVGGNTNANGMWRVTKVDSTNFTLNGSAGNAAYTSGGAMRKRTGSVITLPPGSVKNISMTGNTGQITYPYNCGNWVGSAGALTSLNLGSPHQGSVNQQIGVAAIQGAGKVAYQALGSVQDFSAFQAISFSLMTTTLAAIPNNQFYLALCSDTAGAVVVDRFDISDTTSTFGTGLLGNATYAMKYHITKTGGGNLGSSIQSVALYANTDPGTPTLQLDNIVAVKALSDPTCISVQHLIHNGVTTDGFWSIGACWNDAEIGPVCTVDTAGVASNNANSPYWSGAASGTYRLYTLLPYNIGSVGNVSTDCFSISFNTITTPIYITGGWSVESSMSEKTGRTAYGTRNGGGRIFSVLSKNGFQWSSFILAYCSLGMNISGNYGTSFVDMHYCAANSTGIAQATTPLLRNGVDFSDTVNPNTYTGCGTGMTHTSVFGSINKSLYFLGSNGAGMSFTGSSSSLLENCVFVNSSSSQMVTISNGGFQKFTNCTFNYGNYGIQTQTNSGGGNLIKNCDFRNAATAGINMVGGSSVNTIQGCTFVACVQSVLASSGSQGNVVIGCDLGADTATPFYLSGVSNLTLINCTKAGPSASTWAPAGTIVAYQNNTNNGSTYYSAVTELSNSYYKTASGDENVTHSPAATGTSTGGVLISSPNSGTGYRNANNKGLYSLGKVNCTANKLVTVTAWLRSQAEAGGDLAQLCVLGGSIAGVSTNVESTATSDVAWQQHSISFTPAESAVVEVYVQYWRGNGGFYADGLSVTMVDPPPSIPDVA